MLDFGCWILDFGFWIFGDFYVSYDGGPSYVIYIYPNPNSPTKLLTSSLLRYNFVSSGIAQIRRYGN
jgi:hypothetical protein